MNRRELLSLFPAAFTLTDPGRFLGRSGPANVSQPDPIRRQFLEARSKGNFWYGLYQWAEALSHFRRACDLGQQCATNEEKAEVLSRLRYSESELAGARYWLLTNQDNISRRRSRIGFQELAHFLQKIGCHREVLETCRRGLHRFSNRRYSPMNQYFRADLNVLAAFSSYCLGDYEGALRLISEVPGEKHADTPILGYKILYLCALGSVRDAAQAAQQYVVRFGRLRTPHRQALGERGIDADSLYLTSKCEESSIRSS